MKLKSKSFIAISSAACLTIALTTGCNTVGRNQQQQNQQQQQYQPGTTLSGLNMRGAPNLGSPDIPEQYRGDFTGIAPGTNNNQGLNTSPGGINTRGGMQLNQQITNPSGFDTQRADGIRRQITGMKELQNPNVIVNGNTALVGYKATNVGKKTEDMRDVLTNKIRQMDNSITNVIATDSLNFVTEINKLSNEIGNNNQSNGLNDRFNKLVQRIMPHTNFNNEKQ